MKITFRLIFLFACFLFVGCTNKSSIVINNFESSTFDKWISQGDAFGVSPATGALPNQQEVKNFEGKGFANSFHNGDISIGTLTSPSFKIERDYINFLIGGGTHEGTYIELLIDGKSIYKSHSLIASETLSWMSWDVKAYQGKMGTIRIVDNEKGSFGHILIDEIEMNNESKADYTANGQLVFEITKKYILVPVENNAPETHLSVLSNGIVKNNMDIRVAQTHVDYWVPIHVEQYKGQKLTIVFNLMPKKSIGYAQIKQTDTFDFDYNEKYRPSYHFTPRYGWMNDPNGMVYYDGEYHLFYQYNPYGSKWGNMTWGHAVSKDLKRWEHLPPAIFPDTLGAIFSGSAVIDKNNTAGFGKNAMIAIYTSAGKTQKQCIAYSTDKGRTFTKYADNPVLIDSTMVDFRDPKVYWHEEIKKWVMTLATGQTVTFYASKDLKEWTKLSAFGDGIGAHGGVWECPDLFPLSYNGQQKWVLIVNINPGAPNGGSGTQYFIGNFDGKTFKADKLPYPLWLDYGKDNYAGVTWNNVPANDGRRIFLGWMNNWDYANDVPTLNFKSTSTVPRELKIMNNGKHLILANYPIKEMEDLRSVAKKIERIKVDQTYSIDKLMDQNTGAYEIEMTVRPQAANNFGFKLTNAKGEKLAYSFDLNKGIVTIDRAKSGLVDFNQKFATVDKLPIEKRACYQIRLLVDKASSECFINGGEAVATNAIYPSEPYNSLSFDTQNGAISIENMTIYKLK